ncbi:MAG: GNAT family N-acetyltransferase [Candidatus Aureabacteria bacterium]|nr:GNAT family N-acetyltransferase [Candidatus Auribacterota bacterium]
MDNMILQDIEEIINDYPLIPYKGCKLYPQDKIKDYLANDLKDVIEKKKTEVFFGPQKSEVAVLHDLPWDTDLFGVKMGKISHLIYKESSSKNSDLLGKMVNAVCVNAKEKGLEHLSCVIDPRAMHLAEAFEKNGFFLKGVLVDYYIQLKNFDLTKFPSTIKIFPAIEKDIDKIAEIAHESFSREEDWYDRFHADTFFSKEKSDLLYKEWLLNSFRGDQADCVLAAVEDDEPVGFITLKLEKDKTPFFQLKYGNVPLNAVSRKHQKKGIYKSLVAAGLQWFKDQGVDVVSVRTQSSTIAVQKVWQRLGAEVAFYHLAFHKSFK